MTAMERTLSSDTSQKIGQEVILKGWVAARRDHGKLVFIDLRDRSGIVQVVGNQKLGDLRIEDVVEVAGQVRKRPKEMVNSKIPTGEIEIEVKDVKILAKAAELPIDMGQPELKVELPTLLDFRPLTLRHPKIAAIFKVQEVIVDSFRRTLKTLDFTEFQAPIIVPATAEGGAEVFRVKYFDYDTYLGQSPQLYKQIMLGVFERVFTVTHAFRAEPSVTTRHLTEYISLDAEMAFIDSWGDLMDTVEYVIGKMLEEVERECQEELAMYQATIPSVRTKIPRLKLREAQEIIFKRTKRDNRKEPDLEPADEDEICRWSREEKGSDFVFITHYPVKKRPFYTYPDPDNPDLTLSFDLLGRGLEWVTGGQRINDYKKLTENIKKWGNTLGDFELYLQAFKYGLPPEGGFALGLERMTMKILGLENIREASLFPRDMERVDVRLSTLQ
jgi:nondiscriminating aspartyl-tRNA synthetase